MRTRSLFTTLACTAVLAGVGAGTAFASDSTPGQPSATPTTTAPRALSTPVPSSTTASTPATTDPRSAAPTTMAPPPGSRQIPAVPSGAPNTGVPTTTSDGHGEAVAVGASLAVLLVGSGTLVTRRRLKGRG